MNELVTVVVPIYNVEKYLDRCISSIINQTYRNIEIILIDDGSLDSSPEICDTYAQKDSRIKVIHKKNEGLGKARNTGIEHATGEYICFFDSDDYVEPDTIEASVNAARENMADLVIFGKDDVTPNGDTHGVYKPNVPKQLFVGKEITSHLLPMSLYPNLKTGEDWNTVLSAWNKLYSTSIIKESGWRFVSEREIISEDFYSLTKLHKYINRVYVLDRVFYHYTVNESSLSRTYIPDRFEKIKTFYSSMISLSEDMGLSDILEQSIKGVTFGFSIGAMKHIVASKMGIKERYKKLKNIIKDDCLQQIVRTTCYGGCNAKKKLLYKAIKYKLIWFSFMLIFLKNKIKAYM